MTVEFVTAADGTRIAFERSGDGPALLLVGGGLSDRSSSALLAPHLRPPFTVWTFDRRGRGDSGDAAAYAVEREIEDIAALLGRIGQPAAVFGHSSGAILSLEAALAGLPISALALYEPPYIVDGLRPRPPTDLPARVRTLVEAGSREAALVSFLREGMGMGDAGIEGVRSSPLWPRWLALTPTTRYDVLIADGELPAERAAALTTPVLVLQGGASPEWMRAGTETLARTLPHGRLVVLPGQGHTAARDAPELLAGELVRFFRG
jgi:pimeloyl-ACP methyl ester carboxylesterase